MSGPSRPPVESQAQLHDWSDDELRLEILATEDLIYTIDCFGRSDLMYLELLYREADRRGWEAGDR